MDIFLNLVPYIAYNTYYIYNILLCSSLFQTVVTRLFLSIYWVFLSSFPEAKSRNTLFFMCSLSVSLSLSLAPSLGLQLLCSISCSLAGWSVSLVFSSPHSIFLSLCSLRLASSLALSFFLYEDISPSSVVFLGRVIWSAWCFWHSWRFCFSSLVLKILILFLWMHR